jgi:hypothetical protein
MPQGAVGAEGGGQSRLRALVWLFTKLISNIQIQCPRQRGKSRRKQAYGRVASCVTGS